MCGVVGILSSSVHNLSPKVLLAMGAELAARGPDDTGYWTDSSNTIAFVHKRLSILDLSEHGHQPMHSPSGRYTICFNGEIYNHALLRSRISSEHHWNGHSDTESLLVAIDKFGLEKALSFSNGMFAFALWDHKSHKLFLVRDRFGEKPLYYGWQSDSFIFASELSAFRKHPCFQPVIDPKSVSLFVRYNNIPAPFSIYHGISKLLPGHILELSLNSKAPIVRPYWTAETHIAHNTNISFEEASSQIHSLIRSSISSQMIADVPVGSFLSGGIDSTLVTAVMQSLSSKPVKSFCIGFNESSFNEAHHARRIATYLGTDHYEHYITASDILPLVLSIPNYYSEPFADSSQIPTLLLSRLARQHVTVSLTGDGGDELFCGYNRYKAADLFNRYINPLPLPFRCSLATLFSTLHSGCPSYLPSFLKTILRILGHPPSGSITDKLYKLSRLIASTSSSDLYNKLITYLDPADACVEPDEHYHYYISPQPLAQLHPVTSLMHHDLLNYLPNDILHKVDRAAMSCSLETRLPFLDNALAEAALVTPYNLHTYNGKSKAILRNILESYIPSSLIDRPKMGFGVPLASWLRGPLYEWADSLLSVSCLEQHSFFNTDYIIKLWSEHSRGTSNHQYALWNILSFQAWYLTYHSTR